MKYDTHAIVKLLENRDAEDILNTKVPTAIKRFKKYCKQLKKLQNEISGMFPDTNYFYDDGLLLMLGDHHDIDSTGEFSAAKGDIGYADGGGF